jgi:hypothetical protein
VIQSVTLPGGSRISKAQLARLLGVSEDAIDQMVTDGLLPDPLPRLTTAPEVWSLPILRRWQANG